MPFQDKHWERITASLEGGEARAMDFLREHLPPSDLDCYPPELFLRFARHAVSLREGKAKAPWCAALDWEVFAHYVLFPRVNDEDLSYHREIFHGALWPWVLNLPSMEERVLAVNQWCCEQAAYQAQDNQRTASPFTVYNCGVGRCGELSAFLVSALRSVGIPARQVYAPRWSHCDDNHAWAEALCGGQWRFLGACEPEPVLDRGWFNTAASRAMLVHTRVFGAGESPIHGEPLGREGPVSWFNQTARYADTQTYAFRALAEGKPAAGARFQLQILNEAGFHTIAVLTAGADGTARAALGRGSLHVCASLDGLFAEGDCLGTGLTLHLAPPRTGDRDWTDFDFRAPAPGRAAPALDEAQKAARAHARRQGEDLRRRRQMGYSIPGRLRREILDAARREGEGCTGPWELDEEKWEDLRLAARGNWGEIRAFLEDSTPWYGESPEKLVRTLPEKDLRDVTRRVLEDHFYRRPPRRSFVPEDIYWQYAACPRISLEPLVPWLGALEDQLRNPDGAPEKEANGEKEQASCLTPAYGNLYWTPEKLQKSRRCDTKSVRLYFAAGMRAQGWPTRLSPFDGLPEIWEDGAFQPMFPRKTGVLRLAARDGGALRAERDWSLSSWTETGWELVHPGDGWRDGELTLTLPVGRYRIITTLRLPSGDQLARTCELALEEGAERTLELNRRPWSAQDLLCRQDLPTLPAVTLEGEAVPDLFRMGDGPVLALWLEEGSEPTEHMLNELVERAREVNALPVRLLFLVRGRDSLAQPALAAALDRLDGARALLGGWAYGLETAARCLGRDPDTPPLAVLCDGAGQGRYSAGGYRADGVELLLRAAAAAFPPL